MALVVAALVVFQLYSHRAKADQQADAAGTHERAQRDLFEGDIEEQAVTPGDGAVTGEELDAPAAPDGGHAGRHG